MEKYIFLPTVHRGGTVGLQTDFFLPTVPRGGTVGLQTDFFPSSPSSPPPPKLVVSIRYRKRQFSNWFDFPGNSSDSYVFLLLLLLFPGVFLSGELSTPVWRTVHRLQAVQ